ncbi:E3 ubiquitin-protein ligase UPL6, partial [Striga asiatica]
NFTKYYSQKCFRGRRKVEVERCKTREKFFLTYGQYCQDVNRQCFGPSSIFLSQLLFFFNPIYVADFSAFVETCRLLLEFSHDSVELLGYFALWQILWLNPNATPNFSNCADGPATIRKYPKEFLQHRFSVVASELMSQ